tara:strand:- start:182 stop:1735 length:1554 start_codon:yes stop_codon:yes gene_type:complete
MKQIVTGLFAVALLTLATPTLANEGEWPCWFGILKCNDSGVIWMQEYTGEQTAAASEAATYIGDFTLFLNNAVIPFLFAIAVLFLVWNIARYFIIEAVNTDSRDKAKRSAIYGVAALVLLVSIWGVVNLLVSGLGLNESRSICPDFMSSWCGTIGMKGATGGTGGVTDFGFVCRNTDGEITPCVTNTDSDSNNVCYDPFGDLVPCAGSDDTNNNWRDTLCDLYNSWIGIGSLCSEDDDRGDAHTPTGGNTETTTGSNDTKTEVDSALAKIIYGKYEDSSNFSYRSGAPRAIGSSVDIPPQTACLSGLQTLQLSSEYEDSQTAYLYYKNVSGTGRWFNITDLHSLTDISFDADNIESLADNNTSNLTLVHTHPQQNITLAGLNASGYPSSASDMEHVCGSNDIIKYWVIDQNNVWSIVRNNSANCSLSSDDKVSLLVIQTLLQLSVIETDVRQAELNRMYNRYDISADFKTKLLPYLSINYNQKQKSEIIALAGDIASTLGFSLTRNTPEEACLLWDI